MREIVIDTETTGLYPDKGHRLVEISAIELIDYIPTGQHFNAYINPKRSMPEEAYRIHGLSEEFLKDFPPFELIKDAFVQFIGEEDTLVIHNADFDLAFVNAELKRANHPSLIQKSRVIDTLLLARKKFPGQPNNLDALCKRFNISLAQRQKHGAFVDAQLLVEIYIELIGGRQKQLFLDVVQDVVQEKQAYQFPQRSLPKRITPEEEEEHSQLLQTLSGKVLWHTYTQNV